MRRHHRMVNLCQLRERKPAHPAKDGQQDTMHKSVSKHVEDVKTMALTGH